MIAKNDIIPIIISAVISGGLAYLSVAFVVKSAVKLSLREYFKSIENDDLTSSFISFMMLMLFCVYFVSCAATYNTFIR